jgi:hypothetical protein
MTVSMAVKCSMEAIRHGTARRIGTVPAAAAALWRVISALSPVASMNVTAAASMITGRPSA